MGHYGGPDVLRLETRPDPERRPGWITVRLEASALNWHDVLVRRGQYASPLPHVPGADGAGTRTDTGEDVVVLPSLHWGTRQEAPSPGWEILGDLRPGTYAELVSVPSECAVPRPCGLGLVEAAALTLVGLTTYRALFSRGRLRAGESLLVLGASGGVATAAVSYATAIGVDVVVTSSSEEKVRRAVELGALAGVDHTADDWVQQARALSPHGAGFDLVLDPVGRWQEAVECLRPGGRCVVLGASAATESTLAVRPFFFGQYDLLGTTMGSSEDMAGLMAFLGRYDVRPPVVDRTYGLGDAAAAHEQLESGDRFGKLVLLHA
jgi:NADPH:quinone reductase-like Zn-dependent oxidoreductase